jgi:hypothetical protein
MPTPQFSETNDVVDSVEATSGKRLAWEKPTLRTERVRRTASGEPGKSPDKAIGLRRHWSEDF